MWKDFVLVGAGKTCSRGNKFYLQQSSGQQSTVQTCLMSCTLNTACNGATYLRTGWCSHFSEMCDEATRKVEGDSYKYVGSRTTRSTPTIATTTTMTSSKTTSSQGFVLVGDGKKCWSQHTKYFLQESSSDQPTVEKCMLSCMLNKACKGITYWRTG